MKHIRIDAGFPGGNILVEKIEGDTVALRQDPRDTPIWWFYWRFRIRGAAGRTVRFVFTDGDVFSAGGPCFSPDGCRWRWLGLDAVKDNAFAFCFPKQMNTAFFSFCIPYQEADLRTFIRGRRWIERDDLTRSEQGRRVEHLVLRSVTGRFRVLLTARHHACESMANYVMEGVLSYWHGREAPAAFLREHVDIHAVPFMDKDGMELGDQGKCRKPHDHNRDYLKRPRYASVRALMRQLPRWRGEFTLALDLHCPWIRGDMNHDIHIVEPRGVDTRAMQRFIRALRETQRGPLKYDARNYIPFGTSWNVEAEGNSVQHFIGPAGGRLAFTLEFPYALSAGRPVTAAGARAFGRDLGRAIARYVEQGQRG